MTHRLFFLPWEGTKKKRRTGESQWFAQDMNSWFWEVISYTLEVYCMGLGTKKTLRKSLLKDPECLLTMQPEFTKQKGFSLAKMEISLGLSAFETRQHEADHQNHAQTVLESTTPCFVQAVVPVKTGSGMPEKHICTYGRIVGDHLQSPWLARLGKPRIHHFLEGNRLLQPVTGVSGIMSFYTCWCLWPTVVLATHSGWNSSNLCALSYPRGHPGCGWTCSGPGTRLSPQRKTCPSTMKLKEILKSFYWPHPTYLPPSSSAVNLMNQAVAALEVITWQLWHPLQSD